MRSACDIDQQSFTWNKRRSFVPAVQHFVIEEGCIGLFFMIESFTDSKGGSDSLKVGGLYINWACPKDLFESLFDIHN